MVASLPTSLDSVPGNLRWIFEMDPETLISTVPDPDTINIVVVGGPTGKSDWVRLSGAPTITKEIEEPVVAASSLRFIASASGRSHLRRCLQRELVPGLASQ